MYVISIPPKKCIDEITHLDIEKKLSELTHTPLLLIQGLKDTVLGIGHFEKYKKTRPDAELLVLQESDHEFSHHEERARALDKVVSWFAQNL